MAAQAALRLTFSRPCPRLRRHEQELEHLEPFPAFRFADYELLLVLVLVLVRRTSTSEVRQVFYSLPLS